MQIDVDTYIGKPPGKISYPCIKLLIDTISSYPADKEAAIIRIFGVTKAGNSVACHVHNFSPYFYVEVDKKATLS